MARNGTAFDVLWLLVISNGYMPAFVPLVWLYFGGPVWVLLLVLLAGGLWLLSSSDSLSSGNKKVFSEALSLLHWLQVIGLALSLLQESCQNSDQLCVDLTLYAGPLKSATQLCTLLALACRWVGGGSLIGWGWDLLVTSVMQGALVRQCACRSAVSGAWSLWRAILHGVMSDMSGGGSAVGTISFELYRQMCRLTCSADAALQ